MDEKFYVVAADGEELPSSFYQSLNGIEVPVLSHEERARINYLLKKIEELIREQGRQPNGSSLASLEDSISRIESMLLTRQSYSSDVENSMETLQKAIRNLSEKTDANSYSLDSIEKSFADLSEKMEEENIKNSKALADAKSLMDEIKDIGQNQGNDEAAAVALMFEEAARDIRKEVGEITQLYKTNQEILDSLNKDIENIAEVVKILENDKDANTGRMEMVARYLDQITSFMDRLAENTSQSVQVVKELSESISESTSSLSSEQEEHYAKTAEKIGELKTSFETASSAMEKRTTEVEEEVTGMAEDIDKIKSDVMILNNKTDDNFQSLAKMVSEMKSQSENMKEKMEFVENEILSIKQRSAQDSEILSKKLGDIKDNQICADNSSLVEKIKDLSDREELHLTEISGELDKMAKEHLNLTQRIDDGFLILREMISSPTEDEGGYGEKNEMLEKMKDLSARQELQLAEISGELEKIAKDHIILSQKMDSKNNGTEIIEKMKDLMSRQELHLTELSSEADKLGRDNLLLSQKLEDNMNAIKTAIDYLARSQAATADVLAAEILSIKESRKAGKKTRKPKSRKKKAKKARKKSKKSYKKKPAPKPVMDEETIAKMDHAILNALAAGKRRGVELTRIVKGDSKLFRARLRLLVSSGRILVNREGKLVYYMLA